MAGLAMAKVVTDIAGAGGGTGIVGMVTGIAGQ
jgi:hypothetical protein